MKFLGCIINESAKLYFLTITKKSWPFKLRMTGKCMGCNYQYRQMDRQTNRPANQQTGRQMENKKYMKIEIQTL